MNDAKNDVVERTVYLTKNKTKFSWLLVVFATFLLTITNLHAQVVLLGQYEFTTGPNQDKATNVMEGLTFSGALEFTNSAYLTAVYENDAVVTSGWLPTSQNINQGRCVQFAINKNATLEKFEISKIRILYKRTPEDTSAKINLSVAEAVNIGTYRIWNVKAVPYVGPGFDILNIEADANPYPVVTDNKLRYFAFTPQAAGPITIDKIEVWGTTVDTHQNRYGMALSGSSEPYTLTDASRICPIIPGGCEALPADVYKAYTGYQPELINEDDYKDCTTLTYTFKSYANYSLQLKVDIPKLTTGPHPFIIWVHGGGWITGSPAAFMDQSTYLASRGIAGVRITYTLTPQGGHFNLGMQELADAFAFVQAHADEWGLDMTRFGYAGSSAGTPLSALAAMQHNGNGCKLYIGCSGIYDFQNNLAGSFASGSANYLKDYPTLDSRDVISAINFIPGNPENIPAVGVFVGTADFTISHLQSMALCDSIISKGGRAEKIIYDYYVHAFFTRGVSDMFEDALLKMYAFAKSVFKMPDVTGPTLTVDKDSVLFETNQGEPMSVQVTVYGKLLEKSIQVSVTGDAAAMFTLNSNSATVSELQNGKTFHVTFNASESGNFSAFLKLESDEVSLSVPITAVAFNPSGVDKVTSGKVWVSHQTLHANGFNQADLKIYNLSGQLIFQQNQLPGVFATTSLNQGIYFVKIRGEESFIQKINII